MSASARLTVPLARSFARLPSAARAGAWAVAASVCAVGFTAIAKYLAADLPVTVIIFFRCLFGLAFLGPWFVRVGKVGLATGRPTLMLARGFNSLLGLFLVFWAVKLIALADVTAINFSKPIFAALGAVLVLGEAMYRSRWTATLLGIAGMLLIVKPGFAEINLGVLLAIGAMLCAAFTAISVKLLTRTDPPDRIAAYTIGCMAVGSAVPALLEWQTPTWEQLVWLAAVGLLANGFQRLMARSYAAADATVVMPFEFSRLIVAAALGWLVFGELSDLWTWIGGTVVFAAGVYMVRAEAKRDRGAARRLAAG